MFHDLIEKAEQAQSFEDATLLASVVSEAELRRASLDEPYTTRVLEAYIQMWKGLSLLIAMDIAAAGDVLQSARAMFEELNERSGLATTLRFLGKYYLDTSDYDASLDCLEQALERTEQALYPEQCAAIYELQGTVHASRSDQGAALEAYSQALILREEIGDPSAIAQVLNNIGNIHSYVAEYDVALRDFYRALELYEKAGNDAGVWRVKGNIALQFGFADDYDKAVVLLQELLDRSLSIDDARGAAITFVNIGYFLLKQGKHNEAEQALREAVQRSHEAGYLQLEATASANLAQALIASGKISEAQEFLDEKKNLEDVLPTEQFEFLRCRSLIAQQQGDGNAAKAFLTQALELASSTEWKSYKADLHKSLRELHRDVGPLEEYVRHNEAYERISDEIKGEDKQRRMEIAETDHRISTEYRNAEKQRALLYSTMPQHIAERMMLGETTIANAYNDVAVLFLDIVSFTQLSARVPAEHLIYLLSAIFTACDEVVEEFQLTKIKTIGDSYLAVSGLDQSIETTPVMSAKRAATAAITLMRRLKNLDVVLPTSLGESTWTRDIGEIEVRIGLHCGPLVAGVIGSRRPQYDVWGDTVNVAARMESSALPGKIHVSHEFVLAATDGAQPILDGTKVIVRTDEYVFHMRGTIEVKGKGKMNTYWLEWDSLVDS